MQTSAAPRSPSEPGPVRIAAIGAVAGSFGMSEAGAAFAGGEPIGFWVVARPVVATAVGAAFFLQRIDRT